MNAPSDRAEENIEKTQTEILSKLEAKTEEKVGREEFSISGDDLAAKIK